MSNGQFYHMRIYAGSLAIVRGAALVLLANYTEKIPSSVRTFYGPKETRGVSLSVQSPPDPDAKIPIEGDSIVIFFGAHGDLETGAQFVYQITDTPQLAQLNALLRGISALLPDEITQELVRRGDRPPTDHLFAEYYTLQSTGQKDTIAQLARRHDYKPQYLKNAKRDYDRRTGRKR